jgi:arylsulfatase A-like enzyme
MRKIEFHVLLAITLLMLSADYSLAKERPAELPNVVFILADDMSYDSVSAYNPRIGNMQTPSIDRLIGQGMSFTDAHSGSSVCTPTRYGILTGRYCWRTRLKSSVLWEWAAPLLDPERLTVAEMLQAQGYYTGMIGKWHLGMDWYDKDGKIANGDLLITDSFFKNEAAAKRTKAVEERIDLSRPVTGGPLDHGFHSYFGVEVPNFPPYAWIRDNQVQASTFVPKPESMFGHPGPMAPGWELDVILPGLAAEAADWIAEQSKTDQPFFLYLPLTSPHTPIEPSAKFLGTSGISKYADFVIETDWVVGHVMEALERAEVADNTLLIFTTDNGTASKANFKQLESQGVDLHYHYKGHKAQIHEGGHRVPFVARWPGQVKAGSECDQTICLNDFMATMADLLAVDLPKETAEDSTSILPLLTGQETTLPRHAMVVNHDIRGTFAIRKNHWKLVMAKKPQLFDLDKDPKETTNVAPKHPEVVSSMTATLERYRAQGRSAAH